MLKSEISVIIFLIICLTNRIHAQDTNYNKDTGYKKSHMAQDLGLEIEIAKQFDSINKSFKTEINALKIKSSSKRNLKKLSDLEDKRDSELKKILSEEQFENYVELRREQRKNMRSLIRKKQ